MAKLTLSDLANLQNETSVVQTINANNTLVEAALEKTLSRDGTTPNEMAADLDMNSNRVYNLPAPVDPTEAARKHEIDEIVTTYAEKTVTISGTAGRIVGGGDLSANRTFDLDTTAVTPASYSLGSFTVDAYGRITSASNGPLTSKGDILVRADSNAGTRFAVGTDGQILTANSGSATGLKWVTVSGTGTVTSVDLTAPAAGIEVSGGPVTASGSITLSLSDDLAALEGLSGSGISTRVGADTWAVRSIAGTSPISVTNGDGVAGNPTISLSSTVTDALVPSGGTTGQVLTKTSGIDFDTEWSTVASGGGGGITTNGGRLTLASGQPIPSADVLAATSIYWTPYKSGEIALYSGGEWTVITSGEITLSLSGATANTNFDIFGFVNAGALALELLAWAGDTTRATAFARQDGVLVKSGDATRRYLGTIRTTATVGQCEDSAGGSNTIARRYVFNCDNRVTRQMYSIEPGTSWSYTTATVRRMNANANIECRFVVGLDDAPVEFTTNQAMTATATPVAGIGLDSTTVMDVRGTWSFGAAGGALGAATPSLVVKAGIGHHYAAPLEKGNTGATFYGTIAGGWNCGITGKVIS